MTLTLLSCTWVAVCIRMETCFDGQQHRAPHIVIFAVLAQPGFGSTFCFWVTIYFDGSARGKQSALRLVSHGKGVWENRSAGWLSGIQPEPHACILYQ